MSTEFLLPILKRTEPLCSFCLKMTDIIRKAVKLCMFNRPWNDVCAVLLLVKPERYSVSHCSNSLNDNIIQYRYSSCVILQSRYNKTCESIVFYCYNSLHDVRLLFIMLQRHTRYSCFLLRQHPA